MRKICLKDFENAKYKTNIKCYQRALERLGNEYFDILTFINDEMFFVEDAVFSEINFSGFLGVDLETFVLYMLEATLNIALPHPIVESFFDKLRKGLINEKDKVELLKLGHTLKNDVLYRVFAFLASWDEVKRDGEFYYNTTVACKNLFGDDFDSVFFDYIKVNL